MYQVNEARFGTLGHTAVLSLDYAIPTGVPRFGRAAPVLSTEHRAGFLDRFDFAPDLGANIGSRKWWRGLASCMALCAATYALSPSFHALPGAVPATMGADAWEAARAQSIAPLAWGGDTGSRMAATDAVQTLTDTPERPLLQLTATIGQGDGFTRALERAGVAAAEAALVARMTAGVVDPSQIAPGTTLDMTLGRRLNRNSARPLDDLNFRARFDMRLSFLRVGNTLSMQRRPIAVDHTPMRIAGTVTDGVYISATGAGAPPQAVETYIRAIASKVQLGTLDNGARFDMVVERARAATGEVQFGKLLYAGMTNGDQATRMIQWTIGGRTEWYDAAGVGQQRSGYSTPVAGRQTSGYGMRFHPILGYSRMHQGVDYAAVTGTPIHAATDGIVTFAGWHGGHGNMVKLNHMGGLGTGYAHMSRIAVGPGARVSQGQVIGYVGSTGLSTGPHLHFEVYRNGGVVNPSSVSFSASSLLSGGELIAFNNRLKQFTATR
ncbi:M23 family metallopeptidase [Sphingomonas sp.]|uniref:M23 family metallopeptidase n=1 Tax=Sphingomonas sp. TaxID=28214 RepID=UPI0025FFE35D|nr:M23 family metallopeptidase [Sphingomonas sp.]